MAKATTTNRTTTITDKYAKPINENEQAVAQIAIVNALIGTYGTDTFNGGDAGLQGYWIKYSEYWDAKLYGTIQSGNLSLPYRCTETIATVYVIDGTNVTQSLYYIQDAKNLDLSALQGKKVVVMLNFVRNIKENV